MPAYKGLNESMQWTQNYLTNTAKKSERDKAWAIIGLVAGAIVLFGRE